jgi:hypothetical protein
LEIGKGTDWFGAIADVASLGSGRVAVVDKLEKKITIFDSLGNRTARFGREGRGPGEYRWPWAMTVVGENLVVWQNTPSSTFTVLAPDGKVIATGSRTVEGDWIRPGFRFPLLNLELEQMGPEDVTRRLDAFGDSGFVHQLQIDEQVQIRSGGPRDFPAPPVYLIRYDLSATVRDTIAIMVGPPTLRYRREFRGVLPFYEQPLFSGRPVWATGEGWIALGHGDSTRVVVRGFQGDTSLIITWPESRHDVTEADKINASKWILAIRIMNRPESLTIYEGISPGEREHAVDNTAFNLTPFAKVAPTVTAAYGYRKCLFLSGFSSEDWVDGTSSTWIVINVDKKTIEGVIRIPESDSAGLKFDRHGVLVRDFDDRFVFTVARDRDGVFLLRRYRLPGIDCSRRS